MSNNNFHLHFVADLRRVVFCLINNNLDGVKTFFDHAHTIYEKELKKIEYPICDNFDNEWQALYNAVIPDDNRERQKLAEKILTLSSIIYLRSI